MSAFEKSWRMLKGNPDARVQAFNPSDGGYSRRDFAIHPAALGAANRQVIAEAANRRSLRGLAEQQGGRIPLDTVKDAARRMVTPEQRANIKNDSFDLKYKNPRFISRILPKETRNLPRLTDRERKARKIEEKGARARRRDAGFTGTGLHRRREN
mgnify:CR=1 FL=1|tara:strand:- start:2892 stop:3356 length:465 start_codon:yes stop_codon:yes gene_type:complete